MDLDGFDIGAGGVSEKAWLRNADFIRLHLGAQKGDSVLDLGCGSGALMKALGEDLRFTGLDYSPDLLQVARRAVPSGVFMTWDLNRSGGHLPPAAGEFGPFDFVLIHGVLHYLDEANAREVVRESLRYARKGVLIGEIPRLELRDESEEFRSIRLSDGCYEQKHEGLKHTFFTENFFEEISGEPGFFAWKFSIFSNSILEHDQQVFRFAVRYLRGDCLEGQVKDDQNSSN